MKTKTALEIFTTAVLLGAAGVVVWASLRPPAQVQVVDQRPQGPSRPEPPVPLQPVSLDGAIYRGSSTAHVGLLEFSDFQCPYCGKFAREILPRIVEKYVKSGQVLLAFRQLPLERTHPWALKASKLAICAEKQGRFWEIHDRFFEKPVQAEGDFRARALAGGVDEVSLDRCLAGGLPGEMVRRDLEIAKELQLSSTPIFLVGSLNGNQLKVRRLVMGARPFIDFDEAIREQLDSAARDGK